MGTEPEGQGEGSRDFKDGFAEGWRAASTELATSHAVNHPVRLDCYAILLERDASASEISDELKESLRTVSYHLDELHGCGVIRCVGKKHGGPRRGGFEYFYRAVTCAEVQDGAWNTLPQGARREIAGRAFRAIVALGLSSLRCEEMETDPLLRVIWMKVPVDAEGDQEVADFLEETNDRAQALKARIGKRLAATGSQEIKTRILSLLGFPRGDPGGWAGRRSK